MSGKSDGNNEFHEQLRLQQLYGGSREEGGGEDPNTYVDPEDGTVYDWDPEKRAWFPKLTEDFLATYHANYGFNTEESESTSTLADKPAPATQGGDAKKPPAGGAEASQAKEGKQKGEKRKCDPGWFDVDEGKNTNVYVSGLPLDITPDEFVEVMSKCGIIMRDPITEEYKVKLYRDNQGNQKGDGLCCYLKKESVELAEKLIDESEIRGYRLHVEAAQFELKGQYDASKKKKKNKDYRKKLLRQQKQLDWKPEKKAGEARLRHERVLIIRNMFHPKDFEEDPLVLNEIREDLRTECEKFGQVKKVLIFDRHPDGVASVAFKEPEEADVCQLALNGRWFGGRKLSAELWDGKTDYQIEETSRERDERLKGWSSFLGDNSAVSAGKEAPQGEGPPKEGGPQPLTQNTEVSPARSPEPGGPVREEGETQGNGSSVSEDPGVESTDSSLAESEDDREGVNEEDE
ncbi:HTSF1 factor, partial [Polyodon spathula]|nr:HIV Tat-specific factor 1 [Polyodon spathula]MBN3278590.1 HTSF1 factor [Polyodon spathula]